MNHTPVPQVGRPGMVATIDRAVPYSTGQHVVLRSVASATSTESAAEHPARTWHAVVLGEATQVDHLTAHEIVVADKCLHPIVACGGEGEATIDAPAPRSIDLRRALRFVPIEWALKSLFAVWVDRGDWRGFYRTFATDQGRFHLGAHINPSGDWILQCTTSRHPHEIVDERRLEPMDYLGRVFLAVAQMWRKAMPDAPPPQLLSLTKAYEDHIEEMRSLSVALPTLNVDGEMFRHLRRRILRRHGPPSAQQPKAVDLAATANMLSLIVDGIPYACPVVSGSWSARCAIDLASLAALPGHSVRGSSIPLAQALQFVRVGATPVPRMACSSN